MNETIKLYIILICLFIMHRLLFIMGKMIYNVLDKDDTIFCFFSFIFKLILEGPILVGPIYTLMKRVNLNNINELALMSSLLIIGLLSILFTKIENW